MPMQKVLDGRYQILEPIGAGGGGTIYKGYHLHLQKYIVLKKIHKGIRDKNRETEILKNLHHTALPQIYDFIDSEGDTFIVMEYIEGQSFKNLLSRNQRFTQKQAAEYGTQLLEVLEYLHTQKIPIIHGDIKPGNIMLRPDGRICLIDFNISGYLTGGNYVTLGYSSGYAAPEQVLAVQQWKRNNDGQAARAAAAPHPSYKAPAPAAYRTVMPDNYDRTVMTSGEDRTVMPDSYDRTVMTSGEDRTVMPDGYDRTVMTSGEDRTVMPAGNGWRPQENAANSTVMGTSGSYGEVMINNASHTVGVQADLYSVGAVLYHLVTGQRPPADHSKTVPLRTYQGISDSFAAIVDKAMAFRPQDRYDTARQMCAALKGYAKTDSRYRRLVLRQSITTALLVLGIAAGAFMAAAGFRTMQKEQLEKYDKMTAQLAEYRENGQTDRFEELYEECIELNPAAAEAYLQKARLLYGQRKFEETIHFVEETAFYEVAGGDERGLGDLYYVLANSYYEMGRADSAAEAFEQAVSRNGDNPEYYRDYAIALADAGQTKEAEQILKQAVDAGLLNDQVALVKGEIEIASGDTGAGLEDLSYCISNTDNEYVRMRAYVLSARAYDRAEVSGENLLRKADLLEQASAQLPLEYQPVVLEDLAKTYISLQEVTSDDSYTRKAVGVLEQVVQNGWANLLTYNNLIVLCQRMDELEEANRYAGKMTELYPERYETYKRLAFLDVSIQEKKVNEERDYTAFRDHYLKAKEMAEQQLGSNQQDMEMEILDDAYEQMNKEGWF